MGRYRTVSCSAMCDYKALYNILSHKEARSLRESRLSVRPCGAGASYRTVQRFFSTGIPWANLFWLFFRTHLFASNDVYLLAGNETVVTKSGKHTPDLDRFFASLYGKSVPGLAFFDLSLISTSAPLISDRRRTHRGQ